MVTMVALALWSGRIAQPARLLALALPCARLRSLAVLSPVFWLSFARLP